MIFWWLSLEIIGIAALPLAIYFCKDLEDRGYSIAKVLGLVIVSYLAWLLTLLFPYSVALLYFSLAAVAALSLYVMFSLKIRVEVERLLRNEVIFTFAFLIFALIRSYSPDYYWTGGEKMMEFGFLKAILRSSLFPPFDPWFAKEAMHYYYFGFQVAANIVSLSGLDPVIGFNLAVASFFALSFNAAFGIGLSLCRDSRAGLLTGFFVAVIGNLMGFIQLLASLVLSIFPPAFYKLYYLFAGPSPPSVEPFVSFTSLWYWASSRVIPDTINEFPFFSFLHADLHPHMISLAFQLQFIFLLLAFFFSGEIKWTLLIILGISLGFFYPLNSWEFPTYAILILLAIALKLRRDLKKMLLATGIVFFTGIFFYLPFFTLLASPREIGIAMARSSLANYLVVFLIFLFFIASFLLTEYKAKHRDFAIFAGLFFLSIALDFQLLVVLIPVIAITVFSLLREIELERQFVLLLILIGALLSLFCELFYIKDAMGVRYHRMNTVFKLYLQNWLLFAIAASYACFNQRKRFSGRKAWVIAAVALIAMGAVYPVFATYLKSNEFKNEINLDGTLYIKREHPGEYEAIRWLNENVDAKAASVVLQAPGGSYTWSSYISSYTGLPAPVGWAGHEVNWRNSNNAVNLRIADVDELYTSSSGRTRELLEKYEIAYIYVGSAEQERYGDNVFKKFSSYELVFENSEAKIYKIHKF